MNCSEVIFYKPIQTSDLDEQLSFSPFLSRVYRDIDIITVSDSGSESE